jgi:hypothetical protein
MKQPPRPIPKTAPTLTRSPMGSLWLRDVILSPAKQQSGNPEE